MDHEQTINTYDRIAAEYAARPVYPLEREITRFLDLMGSQGRVIDVGSGAGQYARKLSARGAWVVTLDRSAGMLAQAAVAGTPHPLQADMVRVPLPCATFDGCFACASLLHLPRVEAPAALIELRRLLRPDGVLYLSLKLGTGEEWVSWDDASARLFVYYRPVEIDRMLAQAGFRVVDGWLGPTGPDRQHRWINRFALASGNRSRTDAKPPSNPHFPPLQRGREASRAGELNGYRPDSPRTRKRAIARDSSSNRPWLMPSLASATIARVRSRLTEYLI